MRSASQPGAAAHSASTATVPPRRSRKGPTSRTTLPVPSSRRSTPTSTSSGSPTCSTSSPTPRRPSSRNCQYPSADRPIGLRADAVETRLISVQRYRPGTNFLGMKLRRNGSSWP